MERRQKLSSCSSMILLVFNLMLILMQMSGRKHFHSTQCYALRMINLDAPQMALHGDTIQLSCSYSLLGSTAKPQPPANHMTKPGELMTAPRSSEVALPSAKRQKRPDGAASNDELEAIYAVKWYRNGREFFRYLTKEWPHKQAFPDENLNIDLDKSDNRTVVLRNVTLKTSGLFACEVSTDAPSFLTKSIERKLLVHFLPSEGPTIELSGGRADQWLYLDDSVSFTCTSGDSKPATQIDWIINETLNLTSTPTMLLDANGSPLFKVTTRRLVHLPGSVHRHYQQAGSTESSATRLELLRATANGLRANSRRDDSPNSSLHQTIYVLDNQAPRDMAQKVQPVFEVDLLYQLPETSISSLNFTLSSNLLQYLAQLGAVAQHKPPSGSTLWSTRKSNETGEPKSARPKSRGIMAARLEPVNTDPSQRRPAATKSTGGKSSKISLQIRCVARVLHLSLSDDIRLKLLDRTRKAAVQEPPLAGLQRSNELQPKNTGSCGTHRTRSFVLIVIVQSVITIPLVSQMCFWH